MISLSIRVVVASFQHIPLGTLPQLTTHKNKKERGFLPRSLFRPRTTGEMVVTDYSVILPA